MASQPTISLKLISQILLMTHKLSKTTDLHLSPYSIQPLLSSPPLPPPQHIVQCSLPFNFSLPLFSVPLPPPPRFFYYFSDLFLFSFSDNFPLFCSLNIYVLRFLPLILVSLNDFSEWLFWWETLKLLSV